jgi:replicative DNA helicase
MIDYDAFASLDVVEELSFASLDRITAPGDLVDRAMERREGANSGIPMPWSKLDNLFRLRPGELVLLGGYSGHGKSAVANQLALHAADKGYKVGIASLELPAEYVFDQMAGVAGCVKEPHEHWMRRFGYWANDKIFFYDKVDSISPNEALQMIIGLRKFHGCDLIVLDALMMVAGMGDDLEAEKLFTQRLAEVCKAFDVCVLLVAHMRKPSGGEGEMKTPNKFDFLGSSNILNVASSAILIHDNKEKAYAKSNGFEVDDSVGDTRFIVAKQRYAPYEGVTHLYKHESCRALCNNKQRMYRPIDIGAEDGWKRKKEDTCQSDEKPIGGSASPESADIFLMRRTPETTSETEPETKTTSTVSPF